jgi:hypothetical protein
LARAERCPIPAIYAALFCRLLQEGLGLPEVLLALPTQYLPTSEDRRAVGMHVHLVILRVRPPEDGGALSWIRVVRDDYLMSMEHLGAPPAYILETLGSQGSGTNFPVPFFLHFLGDDASPMLGAPGMLRPFRFEQAGRAKCDLCLHVLPQTDGMQLTLEGYEALIDANQLDGLAQRLGRLVENLTGMARPD